MKLCIKWRFCIYMLVYIYICMYIYRRGVHLHSNTYSVFHLHDLVDEKNTEEEFIIETTKFVIIIEPANETNLVTMSTTERAARSVHL